jgi:CubicO group peptidase (beta-lactamase class C family)
MESGGRELHGELHEPATLEGRRLRLRYEVERGSDGAFVNDSIPFAPGTRFRYSNAGFQVLGRIIERVSGQSYHDYVPDHIFISGRARDGDGDEPLKA